jgi:hypothetical protein
MRTEWPSTRREWFAAVLRFLTGYRASGLIGVDDLTPILIRNISRALAADLVDHPALVLLVYRHLDTLLADFKARGMPIAAGRCNFLQRAHRDIAGVGAFFLPSSQPTELS